MRPAIAITGMGATSAVGRGVRALDEAQRERRSGIARIEGFDVSALAAEGGIFGGEVREGACARGERPAVSFAIAAAREAVLDAGLDVASRPRRVALVVGTSLGDERADIAEIARAVADALGARGLRITVSTACASSTNAIGLGCDLLAAREADAVVAGGSDVLSMPVLAGFHALGLVARQPCAPFSSRVGTTLGEGAGFVVLERADERVSRVHAYVSGHALSSDAHHETSPDPRGHGVARAMRGALVDAALAPRDVECVSAHGTGTLANDDGEWRALGAVFEDRRDELAITASKSVLGHAQGAAGVLELVSLIHARAHGEVPVTLGFEAPRANGPRPPTLVTEGRALPWRHALKTSSAFGGANACLAVSMDAAARPLRPARTVRLRGLARVRPEEASVEALRTLAPQVDPRSLDPSGRHAVAAVARALASIESRAREPVRERAGLVLGATRVSPACAREYRSSLDRRGPARASATAFARLVLHAPAGAAALAHTLRGPTSTVHAQGASGILALVYAARVLRDRSDADRMIALAVDEADAADARPSDAGGIAAVLDADGSEGHELLAVALGAPGALDETARRARALGGVASVELRVSGAEAGALDAVGSLAPLEDAVRALETGARVVEVAIEGVDLCAVALLRASEAGR